MSHTSHILRVNRTPRRIRYMCAGEHLPAGKEFMKPPRPLRSARDLPVRIRGSAEPVTSTSASAWDGTAAGDAEPTAPKSTDQAPRAGVTLPRLTQFSSLGSRRDVGRSPAASSAPARSAPDISAGSGAGNGFGSRSDEANSSDAGIAVPLRPAERLPGGSARRAGSRGALTVVGIVGLLAMGGVLLTLGVVADPQGEHRDGGSTSVDSRGYGGIGADRLGDLQVPSAGTSGSAAGKDSRKVAKPTAGSPTSSAASDESAAPGRHQTAPGSVPSRATQQAPSPGVNVVGHASGRCIDVVGGKAVQGARLMIWDCSKAAASQHWVFAPDGSMRGLGMCVHLAGGSTAKGTDLELAHCDGSPAQQFALNYRRDLVNGPADKCADVRDSDTANGTRLQLWSCAGSDNQKWSMD